MNFYTHLFIDTILFLILTLIVVGYCMTLSKNQEYPPAVADCPDYYSLDASGECHVGSIININDISCNHQNFTQNKYIVPGTDFKSGLCAKKLWANKCDIKWDGLSNNDSICYT